MAFAAIPAVNTESALWNAVTISLSESSAAGSVLLIMFVICVCNAVSAAL